MHHTLSGKKTLSKRYWFTTKDFVRDHICDPHLSLFYPAERSTSLCPSERILWQIELFLVSERKYTPDTQNAGLVKGFFQEDREGLQFIRWRRSFDNTNIQQNL